MKISKVNLCFDLTTLENLEKEKLISIKKKKDALKYFYKNGSFPENITEKMLNDEINLKEEALEKLEAEFLEGATSKFCGTAFVSFSNEEDCKKCLEINKISTINRIKLFYGKEKVPTKQNGELFFHGKQLIVEEPSEPGDVLWNNQKFNTKTKISRRILSSLAIFLCLAISASIIYYLNLCQKKITMKSSSNKNDKLEIKAIGILISCVIAGINFVLGAIIKFFSKFNSL